MFGRYQHDRTTTTTTTTKPLAASLETRQDRRETRPRNWRAAENAAEMLTDGGANERRARLLLPLRAAARCPAGLSRLASLTCLMYRCCLCDDVRARRNGPPRAAGRFVYPTVLWVETIRIPRACGRVRVGGRMHVTTGIAVTFRRIWKIRGCKVTDNLRLVLGLILLVLRTFCHVLINGSQ